MQIFVGYGYNDRDVWIERLVFPVIEAFGANVLHGKDMHGQVLQDGVKARIEAADGLLAFATRRDLLASGRFSTHTWVRDELVHALAKGKASVLILEDQVDFPQGIIGNRQYIPYREDDRAQCLVEVAKVVGDWSGRRPRRIQLLPNEKIRPLLIQPGFCCQFRMREGNVDSALRQVPVDPVKGGLYVDLPGVPSTALVQIEALVNGQVQARSDYDSVDAVQITLY
jgi:hypothetical protein